MRTFAQNPNRPQHRASFTLTRANPEGFAALPHVQRKCAECETKEEQAEQIQRKAGSEPSNSGTPPTALDFLNSSGAPIDAEIRRFVEPRFGYDFSRVKIHTDDRAAQSARAFDALAYTFGEHIVFGANRYSPTTDTGRHLLAHELTHVLQQSRTASTAVQRAAVNDAGDPAEREADSVAGAVSSGSVVSPATTGTVAAGDLTAPEANFVEPDEATPVEPLSGRLPGAPSACVVNAALPYSRSGIIRSKTGTVGENFEVRAEWRSAPAVSRGETSYCAAECGEYHQFIKGHMLSSANQDGSGATDVSAKVFGGVPLDEKQFREDGLDSNPKARYGHRKEPQTMNEKYEPDRAAGTKYTGKDFPNVSIGTFADIDLTFLGKLVDTCNGTESLSDSWRAQYRGIIRP